MTKALILVEGETDIGVTRAIMRKLGFHGSVRRMRGNRIEKVRGFLRSLEKNYDKFIVLKDLERYEEVDIHQRFNAIQKSLTSSQKKKTKLVIVKRAIESWLLADPNAIKRAFGCKKTANINKPESVTNPTKELDNILRRCGKKYLKGSSIAPRIAEELDLRSAMKKSKSLGNFCKSLRDP